MIVGARVGARVGREHLGRDEGRADGGEVSEARPVRWESQGVGTAVGRGARGDAGEREGAGAGAADGDRRAPASAVGAGAGRGAAVGSSDEVICGAGVGSKVGSDTPLTEAEVRSMA